MNKHSLSISLVMALVAALPGLPSIAQSKPLTGQVEMSVNQAMRINRSSLRRSSGVDATDWSSKLLPQQAQLAPLVDSRQFEGGATETQKAPTQLSSGLIQQVASKITATAPLFNASATKADTDNKLAPYIWYQSSMGGYFDGSRTTSELVRADRLHLFGGKFADGTMVPKTPIRDYNAMGHAFKQAALNTDHFWNH